MINRIFFTVIIAGSFLLISCGGNQPPVQQQAPPVPISVYTVKQEEASYFSDYPATVTALNEVQIRAQVSGYITGIYFKDGQKVNKGMKLYTVDQQQYQAGYDQSVANLNVAKANLARAQQDADRYLDLEKKDAIAKQVVDHALADLQTAKMQVSAAQANVRNVQTGLRYATIYAPLTGTIGISEVKLGAAVTPGVTILNTVSSDDPIAVDVAVDEKLITHFTDLQQKSTQKDDSTFRIVLPDQTVYSFPGHIYMMDRAIDPATGTIKARLVFPNNKGMLKPGMSCNIRVENMSTQQILIPYKAVVEQMGEYFVYVINGDKATQRKVSLSTRVGDKIIVSNGLQVNEVIATEGVQKLRDGAAVQVGAPSNTKQAK